ncbi:hypothetical protein C8F04DRAFT_1238614 [Mycena alexandri]|uniref:Uncharacterized protein n=1 Tax=Mycena alexandri TaxID=1745969 RepID=A0AAD6SI35_9AGAR|nr:hypothetical protein C8F04DRAFT_1238614 [Mycena alexandri]
MFSRMLSLGNRAVALAAYDVDFAAVPQRSEQEGSLYSFKKLSELELDVEDDTECRKFLWNYVVFRAPFEDAVEKPIHAGDGYHARAVCDFAVHCIVIATGLPTRGSRGWVSPGTGTRRDPSSPGATYPKNNQLSMSFCMRALAGLHGSRVTRQPAPRLQPFGSCESLGDAINSTKDFISLLGMWGGVIVDSFLDLEAQSDGFSTSILVRARAMNGLIEELGTNSCFVGTVLLSRYHTKESTPELLEMSYGLDLVGCEIRSSVDFPITAPGYSYPPMCYPYALVFHSTSISMLGRLKANRVSSLAKRVYNNRDFFAVRDRTDGHQDVYNFKAGRAQAIDHEAERKNELREHVVSAFGEIRSVYCVDATCDGINVFRMQLRTLRIIIEVDEADLQQPGDVIDSWFSVANEDIFLPPKQGSFYIVLRPRCNAERTAMERLYSVPEAIGRMLECKLVLERRLHYQRGEAVVKGYELTVIEMRLCDSDEIARISEGYACDIKNLYKAEYEKPRQAGRLALAAVEYGVDFEAVREMSTAEETKFLFVVDLWRGQLRWLSATTDLHRKLNYISEPVYQRWIDVHDSSRIVCLRIWGFATGSCEGKRVYRQQLHQLRKEVSVAESWFDMSSYCRAWEKRDDCFYVMPKDPRPERITRFEAIKPGDGIAFCCTMTRIDRTVARSKIANPGIWRRPDFNAQDHVVTATLPLELHIAGFAAARGLHYLSILQLTGNLNT